MEIEISKIRVDYQGGNESREDYDMDYIQELAADIEKNGLIQPVVVRPITHDEFECELIVGFCRMMACETILGETTIDARVAHVDDMQAKMMNIAENLKRRDATFWEQCSMLHRVFPEDFTAGQIGRAIGKDRGWVRNRWGVFKMPQEVIEQVKEGLLTAADVNILLAKTPEEQVAAATLVVAGKAEGKTNRELAEEISNRKTVRSLHVVRRVMTDLLEQNRMNEVHCLRWAIGEISETMLLELLDEN